MSTTSNNKDENDAKSEEIINLGINKENSEKDVDLLTDEEQEAKKSNVARLIIDEKYVQENIKGLIIEGKLKNLDDIHKFIKPKY